MTTAKVPAITNPQAAMEAQRFGRGAIYVMFARSLSPPGYASLQKLAVPLVRHRGRAYVAGLYARTAARHAYRSMGDVPS